jgi:hypothetical protein
MPLKPRILLPQSSGRVATYVLPACRVSILTVDVLTGLRLVACVATLTLNLLLEIGASSGPTVLPQAPAGHMSRYSD